VPELLRLRCSRGRGIFRVLQVHLARVRPTSVASADCAHTRPNYPALSRSGKWHKSGHGTTRLSRLGPAVVWVCAGLHVRTGTNRTKCIEKYRFSPQKYRFSPRGAIADLGTDRAHNSSMSSGLAFPISLGIAILMAALPVGGCGSSDASASSAGVPSEAGGSSQAGAAGAGHGGNAGTAGEPGSSGMGGSGGAPIAGASSSAGGATVGASGSGGHGIEDMSDPACPAMVPAIGATCSKPGVCNYSDCAGAGQSIATCDGVKFSVTSTPCQSVPCGTTGLPAHALYCLPNELCVQHQAGNSWYECRPDPCAPGAQACGCASTLCGANSSCSFQNFKLVCSCTGSCA